MFKLTAQQAYEITSTIRKMNAKQITEARLESDLKEVERVAGEGLYSVCVPLITNEYASEDYMQVMRSYGYKVTNEGNYIDIDWK